ncbi:MAG TPA: Gfo/Idh/MocA family oxidoreductase [bacterium]|nr:Gfo/Idh/MocA family oxidoreductase [bacterium]
MLTVAVVGAGLLGARHARAYAEMAGCRLAGVYDVDAGRAGAVAARHGVRAFPSLEALLRAGVDAVSVATPDHAHHEPAAACLAAAAHVLVEKPLTIDPAEADGLIRLAAERGRVLMVNYSQRWLPESRRIERLIASGALGEIAFIESHRWDAAWVPGRMIAGWAARTTPIHFMSSHDIDLILAWTGRRARRVFAVAHRGARAGEGVVDGYDALVTLDGGARVSLHSSWILPDTFPAAADSRLEILGAEGAVFLDGNRRELAIFARDHSERVAFAGPRTADDVNGRLAGAFVESLSEFVRAAGVGDLGAPTSAARTRHVVDVQAAVVASAARGIELEIPPDGEPRRPVRPAAGGDVTVPGGGAA